MKVTVKNLFVTILSLPVIIFADTQNANTTATVNIASSAYLAISGPYTITASFDASQNKYIGTQTQTITFSDNAPATTTRKIVVSFVNNGTTGFGAYDYLTLVCSGTQQGNTYTNANLWNGTTAANQLTIITHPGQAPLQSANAQLNFTALTGTDTATTKTGTITFTQMDQ
jgi:hypothetical protein